MKSEVPGQRKLLVVGHTWPEPEATAAGQRMMQLLHGFLKTGYAITFASTATPGQHDASLEALGIRRVPIRLNHPSFDAFVAEEGFGTVLFDRFMTEEQFGWRVRRALPGSLLLLDTEDLHALRHSRERALERNRAWGTAEWTQDPLFFRELASLFRADLSLIISRVEHDLLLRQVPLLKGKLLYFPFQMEPRPGGSSPPFGKRSGFVFVGNGKHRPNLDAIRHLKEEIWPELGARLPGVSLKVYGAYLPESIRQWHAPRAGFEVLGWAPDLRAVMEGARLQLAPLRFGAGIKGKVLNALAHGLPTLSTPVGLEGILPEGGEFLLRAASPSEFAGKAVTLYQNETLWKGALEELTGAAKPHFTPDFSPLEEALDRIRSGGEAQPPESRLITGMLRSEAFDRVRYLSRWIEAKESRGN